MSKTKATYDIAGLIKYADRSPWAEAMDETLSAHLGPVLEDAGLDPEALFDRIGSHWEGNLWGCAFEDLLTQEIGPDGLNLVEDYLKRRGWNEKAPSKAYMRALRHSVMSLYEVSEVVPGQSMKLRDLLRDAEPVTVHERSATQTLVNWDRIAARVVEVRATHGISGALLSFGPEASAELIAAFARLSASPDPDAGFDVTDRDQLLRHTAPLFTAMWLRDCLGASARSGLPELVNADGEDVVFHRIVFPIAKGATQRDIAQRLDAIADLETAGPKFWNWLLRAGGNRRTRAVPTGSQRITSTMDDGTPVFGTIALEGRRVAIEVNSAERAESARMQLSHWLDALVGTPLTEIRTLEQMLNDDAHHGPHQEEPELDPQDMERIVHAMLDREYASALDEPVPMLGGKTPRALARTKAGRTKVAEWLKYLEHGTARTQGSCDPMASYDFSWMWAELGIADLRK
ncbi:MULTISPECIES: antitoxin Xre/MbcA/ParS toxin-binding domain-containing protein [Novosphingobium]|uniref:DUF2384 domain-containing protein n=1 Tax=Novosphingobium mangrovi (ex Huang et al. 2023) TaxID=2976432 RepID=A0ABT2I5K3_9SPHN|nr:MULTISPECIES: antitoxin Xre/MbcA/ParS toxin-binding domain-containing protein [Novosphingobium]MCT2400089.1 DUF2384 domain-containing protein [Novosphingobium mangrovi (ex Huang et al. 2023)]CCA93089.1 conserved hypothetical protein [Novosphingobium sp. PP1Y]